MAFCNQSEQAQESEGEHRRSDRKRRSNATTKDWGDVFTSQEILRASRDWRRQQITFWSLQQKSALTTLRLYSHRIYFGILTFKSIKEYICVSSVVVCFRGQCDSNIGYEGTFTSDRNGVFHYCSCHYKTNISNTMNCKLFINYIICTLYKAD